MSDRVGDDRGSVALSPADARPPSEADTDDTYPLYSSLKEPRGNASSNSDSREAYRRAMLRRRVLSMEEFAREQRDKTMAKLTDEEKVERFGAAVVPIPVPLDPGETREQYEDAFERWLASTRHPSAAGLRQLGDPNRERTIRFSYAITRLSMYKAEAKTRRQMPAKEDHGHEPWIQTHKGPIVLDLLPRHVTNATRYVDLEQHKRNVRAGMFARTNSMSFEEKIKLYGVPIAPIFAPLARGETEQEYENRFVRWLTDVKKTNLQKAQNHKHCLHERFLRLQFASANTKGVERYIPHRDATAKRERSRSADSAASSLVVTKRMKADAADDDDVTTLASSPRSSVACPGNASVPECEDCCCHRCLLNAISLVCESMAQLEEKVPLEDGDHIQHGDVHEPNRNAGGPPPIPLSDLTRNESEYDAHTQHQIEHTLVKEYEDLNEQIIMNETVLENETLRIASTGVHNIDEITRLHDENEEFKELLCDEIDRRSSTLALAIAYMWRDDQDELDALIHANDACDIAHVQRSCHRKCAELATQVAHKQDQASQLQKRVEHPKTRCGLDDLLSKADAEIKLLESERRREFTTLIHFDAHLRRLIDALLTTARVAARKECNAALRSL